MKNGFSDITPKKATDTCMAVAFVFVLLAIFTANRYFLYICGGVLVLGMLKPVLFYPLAWLWFGLSAILGKVMSKLMLGIVFFLIVTPVGLLRRLLGKDVLKLKLWNSDSQSFYFPRKHTFTGEDTERTY